MPMDFPDMRSLIDAAEVHKFRQPREGESEADFRLELAHHVESIDLVEAMEIRTGKGWDQFTPRDNASLLIRSALRSTGERIIQNRRGLYR